MRDKQTGNVYNGKREEKFKTLKNMVHGLNETFYGYMAK